jgi:antitoxin (DNA-binding transcriptional repressor) of toxin-antitoxin stability system
MTITNVYQAKSQLSSLVDQALAGQQVVIARYGKPLVQLVPYQKEHSVRQFGVLRGSIHMPDSFNEESALVNDLFYGGTSE